MRRGGLSARAVAVALAFTAVLGPGSATAEERRGPKVDPLQKLYRHNQRGNREFAGGKVDAALRQYVEAQGQSPDDPRVLYNLGNALARQGKTEEALTTLERAAQGTKDRTLQRDARFNRGVVQMEHQDPAGAVQSFARALTVDPNDEAARRNLELALRQLKMQQQQSKQQQGKQGDKKQDQKQNENQKQQQQRQNEQQQNSDQGKDQKKAEARPDQGKQDPQKEAARRLLKALESGEKDALKKALRARMPNVPDRKEDW